MIRVEKTWIGTRWHWFRGFQYSDDPVNLYFNIAYISQIPLPFLYSTYSHLLFIESYLATTKYTWLLYPTYGLRDQSEL